jgi:2-oxoisovalerate dehydrogenase E1 component alpha subunit
MGHRVLFPGALNSKFTNILEFLDPKATEAIPTFRVMNQYGEVVNKDYGVDTTDEEALNLYRNMVTRMYKPLKWQGIHY